MNEEALPIGTRVYWNGRLCRIASGPICQSATDHTGVPRYYLKEDTRQARFVGAVKANEITIVTEDKKHG